MDDNTALSNIRRRLRPGETLIWHGTPDPWHLAGRSVFGIAFMTVWTAGVLSPFWGRLWFTTNVNRPAMPPATIWIAIFAITGVALWFVTLKSFIDGWRTAYGLTNQRVIVAVGENGSTQSYVGEALSSMERSGSDAKGSLRFDFGRRGRSSGYRGGFYGIKNPARVESLIYQTLIMPQKGGAVP